MDLGSRRAQVLGEQERNFIGSKSSLQDIGFLGALPGRGVRLGYEGLPNHTSDVTCFWKFANSDILEFANLGTRKLELIRNSELIDLICTGVHLHWTPTDHGHFGLLITKPLYMHWIHKIIDFLTCLTPAMNSTQHLHESVTYLFMTRIAQQGCITARVSLLAI